MDLPSRPDDHGEIFITGVESEEVEEVNDAYKDILEELGTVIIYQLPLVMLEKLLTPVIRSS